MKRKSLLAGILSLVLASSLLLSGCGGGTAAQAPAEETGAAVTSQETEAVEEEAPEAEAAEETAPEAEAAATETEAVEVTEQGQDNPLNFAMGQGFMLNTDIESPEIITAEEEEEIMEASRAFSNGQENPGSLLINKAEHYYYYEQLNPDEVALYDIMQTITEYPTSDRLALMLTTTIDPESEAWMNYFYKVYYALMYDHPEYFWLYNYIETAFGYMTTGEQNEDGTYNVLIGMTGPYTNYEEQMTKFNTAVDEFLADIDTSGTEEETVRQIHDKLIGMLTYDMECLSSQDREISYYNFAHTAYGALVENSQGQPNTCVCDGYSAAFCYLCQQVGIEASTVVGVGGNFNPDGTKGQGGGHAWNVVKTDGTWHEVDSTWDDNMSDLGFYEEIKEQDPVIYGYLEEAMTDEAFYEKAAHVYFLISTPLIEDYSFGDSLFYTCADGTVLPLANGMRTFHERASQENGFGLVAATMELLPVGE